MSDYESWEPEGLEEEERAEFEDVCARLLAYVFPNTPPAGCPAFARAAQRQWRYERERRERLGVPDGVTEFQIGHFRASLSGDTTAGKLSRKTISDAAYGELLRAGLLYRGVEGRRAGCPCCLFSCERRQ